MHQITAAGKAILLRQQQLAAEEARVKVTLYSISPLVTLDYDIAYDDILPLTNNLTL